MKCPESNSKEMIECLRKVDAEKIVKALYDFYVSFVLTTSQWFRKFYETFINLLYSKEWDIEPVVPFPPVVEKFDQLEEAFISDYKMQRHSFDIPWIVGLTHDEGLFRTAGID